MPYTPAALGPGLRAKLFYARASEADLALVHDFVRLRLGRNTFNAGADAAPAITLPLPLLYSFRSAIIGSTFAARRAGTQQASREMNNSRAPTAVIVSGSVACTP